jgi:hypothetical protein
LDSRSEKCVVQCDCGRIFVRDRKSIKDGRSTRCGHCARGHISGGTKRREATPAELEAALVKVALRRAERKRKGEHGNTWKTRILEEDGQIPLLCETTGSGRICKIHGEPMRFGIEHRKKGDGVAMRGRWECPLCCVLRRGSQEVVEERARKFISGESNTRVGRQAVKLLPKELRDAYEAEGRSRKAKRNRKTNHRRHMLAKYGLTPEEWQEMWDRQGGKCGSCDDPLRTGAGGCAVDHNHETGKVRELLCIQCNVGLGFYRDDLERLKKAAQYLRRHSL